MVLVGGISISGADAGDYTLQNTIATTTANITPAPLTVTATGRDASFYDRRFGSSHPGVINGAFGDGSVRVIRFNVSLEAFQRICNRHDGLVVDLGDL
jgi:prepilin-type processing-associated H-X9-DG protein